MPMPGMVIRTGADERFPTHPLASHPNLNRFSGGMPLALPGRLPIYQRRAAKAV
jgi:hypothetical protein